MDVYDLVRLDPRSLSPELHPLIVNRLLAFRAYEAVVQLFERVGAHARTRPTFPLR